MDPAPALPPVPPPADEPLVVGPPVDNPPPTPLLALADEPSVDSPPSVPLVSPLADEPPVDNPPSVPLLALVPVLAVLLVTDGKPEPEPPSDPLEPQAARVAQANEKNTGRARVSIENSPNP